MYINKSIECESGNHDACCDYNDGEDFDNYYEWQCECRCHTKKNKKRKTLTCFNCGSSSIDDYSEEGEEGGVALISFTCADCLSKTSTTIITDKVKGNYKVCECSYPKENSCEYIGGVVYCITCGGIIYDDGL